MKDGSILYNFLCRNNNYQKKFDENLKKRISNTCKFSNDDFKKFACCCRKVFSHMNTWVIGKSSMKHHYKRKKIFAVPKQGRHNPNPDYTHAKIVSKDFKIKKKISEYVLYVESDTLLLADVFNNFRNICALKYMGLILLIFFLQQD